MRRALVFTVTLLLVLVISFSLTIGLTVLLTPMITDISYEITTKTKAVIKEERVYHYIEPKFMVIKSKEFTNLYTKCLNINVSADTHYIGTITADTLRISLYSTQDGNGARNIVVIYHTLGDILTCILTKAKLVEEFVSDSLNLANNVTGYYKYRVYLIRLPLPKTAELPKPNSLKEATAIAYTVIIREVHVEGVLEYKFGPLGEYVVYLKGIVWIKEESNGSKMIINAVEKGSYDELKGAMQFLFSRCKFTAGVEWNEFIALIKAKFVIAENTCPFTQRCRGRPSLTIYPDRRLELDSAMSCGVELGCGCYGI